MPIETSFSYVKLTLNYAKEVVANQTQARLYQALPVCAGKKLVYSTRPSLTIGSTLIVQATDLPKNVTEKQQTL